jgi:2-polyprenyl-6-methoxyphenol hydroxylase-like FAD-dependent oxidoreductase
MDGSARFGYDLCFLDRHVLIRTLYDAIRDKSKIHRSAEVLKVETKDTTSKVTITTKDGTEYTGDILVGADGVNSRIRQEMWTRRNRGIFPRGNAKVLF